MIGCPRSGVHSQPNQLRPKVTQYKHGWLCALLLQGQFQRRVSSVGILKWTWHIHVNKYNMKGQNCKPYFLWITFQQVTKTQRLRKRLTCVQYLLQVKEIRAIISNSYHNYLSWLTYKAPWRESILKDVEEKEKVAYKQRQIEKLREKEWLFLEYLFYVRQYARHLPQVFWCVHLTRKRREKEKLRKG